MRRRTLTTTALQLYVGNSLSVRQYLGPDANRASQIPNPSVAALYEDALVYEPGSAISSSGALTAYSGKKTGRSPLDKRIVQEPGSEKDIWWGPVNKPMSTDVRFPFYGITSFFLSLLWHQIHRPGCFTVWSHDLVAARDKPLLCRHEPCGSDGSRKAAVEMTVCCAQIGQTSLAIPRPHNAYPLFPLVLLNCGCSAQKLLDATFEGRPVLHMPLVTEIISATFRPSSCTPLIPQPKPAPTSARRFLRFPFPVSRSHIRTAGINKKHKANT